MHPRGIILGLICLHSFMLLSAVAGEPRSEFWIVRAGNETADPLVEAVEGKKLAPDALASRITALIDGRKIEQLARFNQTLGVERITLKSLAGDMPSPAGDDKIDLGVTLEAEITLARDARAADIRCAVEIRNKKTRDEYFSKSINSAKVLHGDHWDLMGIWKNAKESTLFLVRVADYPGTAGAEPTAPAVALQVELMEINPEDIAQFGKSTPATRQKAAVWLRGRSKLLAASVAKLNPGQRGAYEDRVHRFADKKTGEAGSGGFTLEAEQITSRDGQKVDISLSAKWQDPEKPAVTEDYQFTLGETLDANQSRLFEPTIAPRAKGPTTMLLVTPLVSVPKDYPQTVGAPRDPDSVPEKLTTFQYPVAAKFKRVMLNAPGGNQRLSLREALAQQGLNFPPGTSVTTSDKDCSVLLTHTREGHLIFMNLLKALDMLP